MPQYQVNEVGFFNDKLYDPKGKRKVLTVDKPFKKDEMPKWVSPLEAKKTSAKKTSAKKTSDENGTSFMGDEPGSTGSQVETL